MNLTDICGLESSERTAACREVMARVKEEGVRHIRVGLCDHHGVSRIKVISAEYLEKILVNGLPFQSHILAADLQIIDIPARFTIAGMYVGHWAVPVVFLAAIVDGFTVALGCLTTVARVAYAIARDGALPTFLSRTHPVHKTPYMANAIVLGLAFVIAIGFALAFPPAEGAPTSYTIEFGYLAGIGAIAIEAIYIFVSIAALAWFRRELKQEYNVFKHLIVPLVAIIGSGAAFYGSFLPQSDPLLQTMPYVVLAWIVVGLLYIVFLRSTKPGIVTQIGRDLAVLGSPEPVDVRFHHDKPAD